LCNFLVQLLIDWLSEMKGVQSICLYNITNPAELNFGRSWIRWFAYITISTIRVYSGSLLLLSSVWPILILYTSVFWPSALSIHTRFYSKYTTFTAKKTICLMFRVVCYHKNTYMLVLNKLIEQIVISLTSHSTKIGILEMLISANLLASTEKISIWSNDNETCGLQHVHEC